MRLRLPLAVLCAAALLIVPAAASASTVSLSPEPAYTKGTSNTWTLTRYHAASDTWLYTCTSAMVDGVAIPGEASNGANGPSTTNCTGNSPAGTSTLSMRLTDPTSAGHTYTLCASGYVDWPLGNGTTFWNNIGTECRSTKLDDAAPALTPGFPAAVTREPATTLAVAYADSVSPPWPGGAGLYTCVAADTPCSPTTAGSCGAPAAAALTTTFSCPLTLAADGRWQACVRGADSAVPDGVSPGAGVPAQANLSDVACATIVLDRTAPALAVTPTSATVVAGDAVAFGAQVTDGLSGVAGGVDWDFGDGTSAHGGAPLHAFAQPGTYVVRATARDAAGNAGSAATAITVLARPVVPAGGGDGTGTPGTPATGGGTGAPTPVSRLALRAPATLAPAKTRRLALALTTNAAGRVSVALVKGARVLARGTRSVAGAGTVACTLRLPAARTLRPGRYTVTASFTARGAASATTRTAHVRVVGR